MKVRILLLTAAALFVLQQPFLLNARTGKILKNVPFYKQEKTKWCWAAGAQMILETYDTKIKQCEIVNNGLKLAGIDCCSLPHNAECNKPGYAGFEKIYNLYHCSTSFEKPLCWEDIVKQIEAGNPIGFAWHNDDVRRSGHYMVVVGYETQGDERFVIVLDPLMKYGSPHPATGKNYRFLTYAEFVAPNGKTHWWDDFNFRKDKKPDCNPCIKHRRPPTPGIFTADASSLKERTSPGLYGTTPVQAAGKIRKYLDKLPLKLKKQIAPGLKTRRGSWKLRLRKTSAALKVYRIGLDKLIKYSPRTNPAALLKDNRELVYTCYQKNANGKSIPLVSIKIRQPHKNKRKWELASFGEYNVRLIERIRRKYAKDSAQKRRKFCIVQIPSMYLTFLGFFQKRRLFLVPVDFPQELLFRGRFPVPAKKLFKRLKGYAPGFQNILVPPKGVGYPPGSAK